MALFQTSVLNNYLQQSDKQQVDIAFQKFVDHFGNIVKQNNIRSLKEEEYQEGFIRDLFVTVLGYTLKPQPDFNIVLEKKNVNDAKKADGAILNGDNVCAVIELKGTDTISLDDVKAQVFGYKNEHKNCTYLITSNFEKLRFYINDATEHIEFNLFNLSKEDFSILYLCLYKENLLSDLPLKIKQASLTQEENITKKLYSDYSTFKRLIFQNIVALNPSFDKLLLYKKTQKLLDRFLFIFFAEDRLLLPPNSVRDILLQWEKLKELDSYVPLYDRFKKYFGYLDKGFVGKHHEIFAYNGGLFEPDEVLDTIKIDDALLYDHTLKLSDYDYQTDVDVNILGHIFEHSLNEIEEVQAEIEGQAVEKNKTKRKKDGVFYTPKYITKYIVDNTVGTLCIEQKKALCINAEEFGFEKRKYKRKELVEKLNSYRNWLLKLTICDPACGSGAFLNQALNFLIEEHRTIDELQAKVLGEAFVLSDIENSILENNLYGVDLNDESVEIAKLSLWLRTAKKGRKLSSLNSNIKCGNSLIDDPAVAGDKAFDWQTEFPNVFSKKKKKAWHITTATHNSRYSQRMFDNHIKLEEAVWLSAEEEEIVMDTLAGIVNADKLNVLACNICGDHLHLLLVCEEEAVPKIVQKIKSMTARACNIAMGRAIPLTREHAPLQVENTTPTIGTREHAPLQCRGTTQYHLWTQKFHTVEVTSTEQLQNTIHYIEHNRVKHELPESKKLLQLTKQFCCTIQHAFRTEYGGGFDVVVGNPPYVRQELLGDYKDYFSKNYHVFNSSSDLFAYFYEKAFLLLKPNRKFGFISNTFDKTTAGIDLRTYLKNNVQFKQYIDFTEVQIFEGATTYPIILIADNYYAIDNAFHFIKIPGNTKTNNIDIEFFPVVEVVQETLDDYNWTFKSIDSNALLNKITTHKTIREQYGKCYRGIVTGFNEAFIISKEDKENILKESYLDGEIIKPFYEGKDLSKWTPEVINKFIIFTKRGVDIEKFPAIKNWLNKYKERLEPRNNPEQKEGRKPGLYKWFEIQDSVDYFKLFEGIKITWPNLQNSNKFCIDENGYYINAPSVIFPSDNKALLAILNSKIIWYYLTSICVVRNGGYIEVKPQYFEQIPVPVITEEYQLPFTLLADTMLLQNKELQTVKSKFIKLLLSKFSDIKINNKLEDWNNIDFKTFTKELEKQKIKLSLSEQSDWIDFFEKEKAKANAIQQIIATTDKEIDVMVYKLYELTEDEIKIVEGK